MQRPTDWHTHTQSHGFQSIVLARWASVFSIWPMSIHSNHQALVCAIQSFDSFFSFAASNFILISEFLLLIRSLLCLVAKSIQFNVVCSAFSSPFSFHDSIYTNNVYTEKDACDSREKVVEPKWSGFSLIFKLLRLSERAPKWWYMHLG